MRGVGQRFESRGLIGGFYSPNDGWQGILSNTSYILTWLPIPIISPSHIPPIPYSGGCMMNESIQEVYLNQVDQIYHLNVKQQLAYNLFSMSKQPKSLSQKNSEKICETLRLQSPQGFKEMAKILANRERTTNNSDCFAKLQLLMASYPQLAQQLNQYLEETIRFPVHKSFTQKLQEFFQYVKTRNLEHINVIIETLMKFEKETKANEAIQTKESEDKLIEKFLQLFKDDQEAYKKAKDIFEHTDSKQRPAPEPARSRPDADYFNNNYRTVRREPVRTPNTRVVVEPPRIVPEPQKYPPDDMEFILKFEKSWPPSKFAAITKVIYLFEHCVISANEALDQIPEDIFESYNDYEIFKDMIETRESSRRRTSNPFKPLNDTDFTNSIRATFSYVEMPWCYPILCKGKTKELRAILNDKWVSVPHGSEHSNFYIRTKNQFQQLLLKSEDERYQFDIYSYRLKMCQKLLDKIISKGDIKQEEIDSILHHVVGMNIIQTIYKNTTKEQKEDLEKQLKTNLINTCNAIKQRILNQSSALRTIRDVHGIKTWLQVADKNFVKSLDRKCSEFKRNERDNTKPQFFEAEIQEKLRYIKKKERPNIFQDPVPLFSILNSFESYSKTERCLSHNIKPEEIPTYDLDKHPSKELLPSLMLLFQNKEITTLLYSFFIYYINSCIPNDGERNKNKKIGSKFFEKILGFNYSVMGLPQNFKEEEFLEVLAKSGGAPVGVLPQNLVVPDQVGPKLYEEQKGQDLMITQRKEMNVKDLLEGEYAYLPLKSENSLVWYFSFNMYVVVRLIYTIYERLVKAFEILFKYDETKSFEGEEGKAKVNLFKILFMIHVKSKENSKFQDQLGDLFGLQSYMFSTIYKLFETLIKFFQSVSGDTFSSKLLDLITTETNQSLVTNQTLYFIYINRLTISHNNSDNLFRINHNLTNNLITVNFFKSAYKSWDDGRDKKLEQKLDDIQRNVEFYVTQPPIDHDPKNKNKKKEKKSCSSEGSKMEYFCFSSGLKLFSRVEYEDYYAGPGRKVYIGNKNLKKEVKRTKKAREFLSSIVEQE